MSKKNSGWLRDRRKKVGRILVHAPKVRMTFLDIISVVKKAEQFN